MVGDVRINGRPPVGELPNGTSAPATRSRVGASSRAAVYLIGADTPLRLDENTVSRFEPPPTPGSGVVELIRGAIYFLSEVRRTLTIQHALRERGHRGHGGLSAGRRPGLAEGPPAELIVLEGQVAVMPGDAQCAAPHSRPMTVTRGRSCDGRPPHRPAVAGRAVRRAARGRGRRAVLDAVLS